ncbi:unnamed protein product [Sphagnum jensenii]|uniref:Uncharacterized protein n=2 Tax=Sphagnum jensenii TaxID=128206 RepID=A0ABP0WKE9_9BRYO
MAVVASTAPPLHMPSALLSCRGGGGGEGGATTTTTRSCSSSSQFQKQPVVVVSSSASSSSWCISRLIVLRRSSAWSSNPRRFCRRDARRTATAKQKKMIRITSCEATGRGFDDRLGEIAAEARRRASDAARAVSGKAEDVFNDVKRKTVEFQEKNDVKGKAKRAARNANLRLEELAFDLKRKVAKWDREYGVSDKAREAADFAAEQVQNVDRQLGIRQKARNATTDLRLKWPTYRKQFNAFLETPIGKSVVTLFMVWFLVSGWAFRIFFFSLWFLPFAGPFLLGTLSKAAIVEGACPNCGARYIGGRNQVVICQQCKGVVWQPRQDFSKKDKQDPTIIDIDIDEN